MCVCVWGGGGGGSKYLIREVCRHTEESLQILFVLWNRHVLDVMNLGRVRSDAIFGVNVAEEADLRLSDCALV